jgi:hypothetical protein
MGGFISIVLLCPDFINILEIFFQPIQENDEIFGEKMS